MVTPPDRPPGRRRTGTVPDTIGDAIHDVISMVAAVQVPGSLNLYDEVDSVAWGDPRGEATDRRTALVGYLVSRWGAGVVLVGEAPGQNGARRTGVPFTSPHQLTGAGAKEPTATVVHRVVAELGWVSDVLFWNASFLFPPGNRDPRRAELTACAPVLARVCRGRRVLAVGRHAQRATGAPYVRHPSHAGAGPPVGRATVWPRRSDDRAGGREVAGSSAGRAGRRARRTAPRRRGVLLPDRVHPAAG